jgi:hypothetical protein
MNHVLNLQCPCLKLSNLQLAAATPHLAQDSPQRKLAQVLFGHGLRDSIVPKMPTTRGISNASLRKAGISLGFSLLLANLINITSSCAQLYKLLSNFNSETISANAAI